MQESDITAKNQTTSLQRRGFTGEALLYGRCRKRTTQACTSLCSRKCYKSQNLTASFCTPCWKSTFRDAGAIDSSQPIFDPLALRQIYCCFQSVEGFEWFILTQTRRKHEIVRRRQKETSRFPYFLFISHSLVTWSAQGRVFGKTTKEIRAGCKPALTGQWLWQFCFSRCHQTFMYREEQLGWLLLTWVSMASVFKLVIHKQCAWNPWAPARLRQQVLHLAPYPEAWAPSGQTWHSWQQSTKGCT